MSHESLLRSALEADAESAPSGAGMLALVQRRAKARQTRVRAAAALTAVVALAGVAGAATLLPLSDRQSLPAPPVTTSASVTPTPRTTVPGLVEAPPYVPPRTLVPGYVPVLFTNGGLFFWSTYGTGTRHDFRSLTADAQLSVGVGDTLAPSYPGGAGGVPEHLTWRPTTIAGAGAQQWHEGKYTLLRWKNGEGTWIRVFGDGLSPAEVRRFAEGLHLGVPDFRPMVRPHLMPAGWQVTSVDRMSVTMVRGRSLRLVISVHSKVDGPWPLRAGDRPAKLDPPQRRGLRGVTVQLEDGRSLSVTARGEQPEQQPLPTLEQLEAIAAAVDVAPGSGSFVQAARLGGS